MENLADSSTNIQSFLEEEKDEPISWTKAASIVKAIRWRWKGWLPQGMATMITSDPGEGKSAIALRIAQSYSSKENWPDGTSFEAEAGKVLWCESEAAQAINLSRALSWGLDTDQLIFPFDNPFVDVSLENKKHQERIKEVLNRSDVRFMVLDSLSGSHSKSEKDVQAGNISKFCAQIARDTDKEVLIIHHLRKQSSEVPKLTSRIVTLDDVRGTSAIVQPLRVIMAIDRPTAHSRRLKVIKSNTGVFPEPIGFEIYEEATLEFFPLAENEQLKSQKSKATALLTQLLKNGPVPQKVIATRMSEEDISQETAYRAKKDLEIESRRLGKIWYWVFPEHLDDLKRFIDGKENL